MIARAEKTRTEHPFPDGSRAACSLGLEVAGERTVVLIGAGTPLPAARSMTFTTVTDCQRAVEVRVIRFSASERPSEILGRFLLPGIRRAQRGEPRIDIGLSLDEDSLLQAFARDRETGACQRVCFPLLSIGRSWRQCVASPGARGQRQGILLSKVAAQGASLPKEAGRDFLEELAQAAAWAAHSPFDAAAAVSTLAGEVQARSRSCRAFAECTFTGCQASGSGAEKHHERT